MELFEREPLYRPKYPVQALEKAIQTIELLAHQSTDKGLGISELNEVLDLGKSTLHRLLDTLVAYEYVERLEDNTYRLGWRLFQIGNLIPRQRQIDKIDIKSIKDLSNEFQETVNLGVLGGNSVVVVSKVDPITSYRVRVDTHVGEKEPIHATGLGKVLFSELKEEEIKQILEDYKLEKYTENTITTIEDLLKEFKKVKEQGYAMDAEEYSPGLTCIAMPVRDYDGNIVAGVSISGPTFRFTEEKIHAMKDRLEAATKKISKHLGYGISLSS